MNPSEDVQTSEQLTQDILAISIRGRQALGALCLRRYCVAHDIHNADIDDCINHCFELATARDIVIWEQAAPRLVMTGLGDPLPNDIGQAVPQDQAGAFERLVENVVEIGYCNLYGATTDCSQRHLLATLEILRDAQVPLPDPNPFKISSFGEWHGWDEVVAPEVVATWQTML